MADEHIPRVTSTVLDVKGGGRGDKKLDVGMGHFGKIQENTNQGGKEKASTLMVHQNTQGKSSADL